MTGLIFLVVLTMIVLAVLRGGSLEELMARNSRDHEVALQSAEAVLRDAEASLFSAAPFDPFDSSKFSSTCVNGFCRAPAAGYTWQAIDWSATGGVTRSFAAAGSALAGLSKQPRYVLEILTVPTKSSPGGDCTNGVVKITSRGEGNGGSVTYVQSVFRFPVSSKICD